MEESEYFFFMAKNRYDEEESGINPGSFQITAGLWMNRLRNGQRGPAWNYWSMQHPMYPLVTKAAGWTSPLYIQVGRVVSEISGSNPAFCKAIALFCEI